MGSEMCIRDSYMYLEISSTALSNLFLLAPSMASLSPLSTTSLRFIPSLSTPFSPFLTLTESTSAAVTTLIRHVG